MRLATTFALICLSWSGVVAGQASSAAASSDSTAKPSDPAAVECWTVKPATTPNELKAYGVVASFRELPVVAQSDGIISGVNVLPGAAVKADQVIARLSGPPRDAALARARADVQRAQANLALARKTLEDLDRTPKGLATNAQRQTAETSVATSETDLDVAKASLIVIEGAGEIRSGTTDGIILAVSVSDGQKVSPDSAIARVQPANALWLEAPFWGADIAALRTDLRGNFAPADGTNSTSIRVLQLLPSPRGDGSMIAACVPDVPPASDPSTSALSTQPIPNTWRAGQSGTVILHGPPKQAIEVPTSALILSGAEWWVVVHAGKKEDQPRKVKPGPQAGKNTIILDGLSVGDQVVVADPYLRFHRDFAEQYSQPD
jgi:RND family efflux transporter MFP subunit